MRNFCLRAHLSLPSARLKPLLLSHAEDNIHTSCSVWIQLLFPTAAQIPGCHPQFQAVLLRPGSHPHLWVREAMSCSYWNSRLQGCAAKFPQQPQLVFQPHFPENTHLAGDPRSLSSAQCHGPEDTGKAADRESSSREDAPIHVCPTETPEMLQRQGRVLTCCDTDVPCSRGVRQ